MARLSGPITFRYRPGPESAQRFPSKKRLEGEELAWYRVASHLGIPVGELRERITFTEFLGWLEYLQFEESRTTKLDFYLAQIAAECRRGWVAQPKQVKVEDFLIPAEPPPKPNPELSKAKWLYALGFRPEKN